MFIDYVFLTADSKSEVCFGCSALENHDNVEKLNVIIADKNKVPQKDKSMETYNVGIELQIPKQTKLKLTGLLGWFLLFA